MAATFEHQRPVPPGHAWRLFSRIMSSHAGTACARMHAVCIKCWQHMPPLDLDEAKRSKRDSNSDSDPDSDAGAAPRAAGSVRSEGEGFYFAWSDRCMAFAFHPVPLSSPCRSSIFYCDA